jgi:hypothetical protein
MIHAYFERIKEIIDLYAAAPFVADAQVSFQTRPGDQGFVTGIVTFINGSELHFREYLDGADDRLDKLMYTYHCQDINDTLIFRYDNANHRPANMAYDHKHIREGVIPVAPPSLEQVLLESAENGQWL